MTTSRKIAQGSLQQIFMFYIVKAIPKKAFDCFPLLLLIISYIWYKQWKVRSGCLEKFTPGNSRGSSDFPEGRSVKSRLHWSISKVWL